MLNYRHTLSSFCAEDIWIDSYLSPTKNLEAALTSYCLEHIFSLFSLKAVLWEEEHTNTIASALSILSSCRLRKNNSLLIHNLSKEFVRNLSEDSDAITGLALCILTCSMLQILYYTKSVSNELMGRLAVHLNYSSDTTVIMLEAAVI